MIMMILRISTISLPRQSFSKAWIDWRDNWVLKPIAILSDLGMGIRQMIFSIFYYYGPRWPIRD